MGVCDVLPRLPLITLQAPAPAGPAPCCRPGLSLLDSELPGLYEEEGCL